MSKYQAPALTLLKVATGVSASLALALSPAIIQILTGAH